VACEFLFSNGLMFWLLRGLFSLAADAFFYIVASPYFSPYTLILYHKGTCSLIANAHAFENHKMQHTIYRGQS
jgi:hypothetical protein